MAFSGLEEHNSMRQQRREREVCSERPRWLEEKGRRGVRRGSANAPKLALVRGSAARLRKAVAVARTTVSCPLFSSSAMTRNPPELWIRLRE